MEGDNLPSAVRRQTFQYAMRCSDESPDPAWTIKTNDIKIK